MIYLAYAVAWICTASTAIAGIYFTNSSWCVWILVLPLFININQSKSDDIKRTEN